MSEKALQPIEQKEVIFYEDAITAVLVQTEGGTAVYVPIKPITDRLGVAWSPQLRRIRRDPVLAEETMSVTVTVTDIAETSRRPRTSEMICLPLDYLSGFLFGISANRVKPELKERVIRYQRECYKVLAEAFQEGRLTADPIFDELLQQDSDAVQAYKMIVAMAKLARNQILIEARLDDQTEMLTDHKERLERVETLLAPGEHAITEAQASQLSQAVKAVALELSKQTRRNEYGGVYGELYRKFEITSYKLLPAARFAEAMKWLTEWHQDLTGEAPF